MLTQEEINTLRRLYHQQRFTTTRLARTFNVSLATVHHWLHHELRHRRAAPHRTPVADLLRRRRFVRTLAQANDAQGEPKYPSARLIAAALHHKHNISVSHDTVRNELHALGLVARVRPRITAYRSDEAKRLAFARANVATDPLTIAFSDEKIFDTNHHGHRQVWIKEGEMPKGRLVSRWPNRVHVWGCVAHGFRMLVVLKEDEKLNKDSYIRKILSKCVPGLRAKGLTFLQDGAACHRAAIPYLNRMNVPLVQNYPARSPDLNVIETLWANLQRSVWAKRPISRGDLESAIKTSWNEIKDTEIDSLVSIWPQRIQNVIQKCGAM